MWISKPYGIAFKVVRGKVDLTKKYQLRQKRGKVINRKNMEKKVLFLGEEEEKEGTEETVE